MPMATIRNTAAGPRVFNLTGGRQQVLQPGETAELDLLVGADDDRMLKALVDRGEVRVLTGKEAKEGLEPEGFDAKALAEAQERLRVAQADVDRHLAAKSAAETDALRRTPPRQFGGDGGPEQMPTVDGNPGAPTPPQEGGDAGEAEKAAEKPEPKAEHKAAEHKPQSSGRR